VSATAGRPVETRPMTESPAQRAGRRRRPSGEAPPLPRALRTSGRLLLAGVGAIVLLIVLLVLIPELGSILTRADLAVVRTIVEFRNDALNSFFLRLDALGSDWCISALRWATILPLIFFKRFRHLFVYFAAIFVSGAFVTLLSLGVTRERPLGVDILGHWEGGAFPSRPVALLAVTLIGITYTLIVPGRPRMIAKIVSTVLILTLGFTELYLALSHPIDVAAGAILGAAIPVIAFRWLAPNEVFPVQYKKGRAAHLDVGGERGQAIRKALQDQLGIKVLGMQPIGLAGSGGSTPLRLAVEDLPVGHLFAKLYAKTHLRADRWYKLGRTLLYGRLEDEASFSTVRRLIQYEDYMERVMQDMGIRSAAPHGIVEITPEREYLLVNEFIDGGKEILDVEVTDAIIDDALSLVRDMWHAGLAHRDIKPSNVLVKVKEEQVYLIDVAFGQVRPSPWRQAVDLANMMLVLALEATPERVYERALHYFTPDEISEAFAATHGVTIPSQSRNLLRKQRKDDLVARFRELAPPHPPISIQRWSVRRVALTVGVLIAGLFAAVLVVSNLQGAGLLPDPESAQASVPSNRPECESESALTQLVLEAQSVQTASKVPCLTALPLGWSFRKLEVRDGSSRLTMDSDRAGISAVHVSLTPSCDTSGATEVPSDEPGTRRLEEISTITNRYSGFRYYVFEGGCASYEFDFSGTGRTALAEEVSLAFSFKDRAVLDEMLREDPGVGLDP
jgi:tRNA A-37 threonylcarbamoyl transferase component Bud32/membrane-associated phospholipid phosphatase